MKARATLRLVRLGAETFGWVALASAHQKLVPETQRTAVFQRWMKRWASSLVHAMGGQVSLAPGSVIPPQTRPRLIVSNHRSPFDIGVLLAMFGGHPLSRADLATWPVIGMAATRAGTIFVDRSSGASGANAVRQIRTRLKEGSSILVFPEGGTFAGDEVRPFKAGAFAALRGIEVEIVPVGLAYDPGSEFTDDTFVGYVMRVASRRRTRCAVSIGAPRLAHGKPQQLAAALQQEVQALVQDARTCWEGIDP
ncbi:MAG TPA: lysophospholipid acyltransferase family protein [Polyangiales bacterium]|nr:lysophospholipid acyltransferase family protein [Polyangiales bacterium]